MIPEYELNMAEEFLEHYAARYAFSLHKAMQLIGWRKQMVKKRLLLCLV